MRAATMAAGLALALDLGATPVAAGQARAADLVRAARAQLGAGNVDSGLVLVGLPLDTLYSCVPECRGLDQPPRPLSAESGVVTVRSGGASPIMGGVALVRFVVDSAGAVEPSSIAVISSPSAALRETLVDHVRPVRFAPGRVQGHAVRVVMQWRLTVRR